VALLLLLFRAGFDVVDGMYGRLRWRWRWRWRERWKGRLILFYILQSKIYDYAAVVVVVVVIVSL